MTSQEKQLCELLVKQITPGLRSYKDVGTMFIACRGMLGADHYLNCLVAVHVDEFWIGNNYRDRHIIPLADPDLEEKATVIMWRLARRLA